MRAVTYSSFFFAVTLVAIFPLSHAHAYLDPGTGSYALQVGIALLFSVAYTVKLMWRRIVAGAKKVFSRNQDTT